MVRGYLLGLLFSVMCVLASRRATCADRALVVRLPEVMRLRGGNVLVNPAHMRRLVREDLKRRENNKGRIMTPEERKKQNQHPERTLMVRNLHDNVDASECELEREMCIRLWEGRTCAIVCVCARACAYVYLRIHFDGVSMGILVSCFTPQNCLCMPALHIACEVPLRG